MCICNFGYSYFLWVGFFWKGGDYEKVIEFEINVGYNCRLIGCK